MLGELFAAVKSAVTACRRGVGRAIKAIVKPASETVVGGVVQDIVHTKAEVVAENALLRQQLLIARRGVKRLAIRRHERLLMVFLSALNRAWRAALHLIQPNTLLRWHRDLFKIVWRRRSRTTRREPRIPQDTIDLIKKMAAENAWGAERIRGELLKLGIKVSKRTVQRHMRGVRDPKKPPQDWKTFLANHAKDVWACDFIQAFDVLFRPIFAFFIVEHESRRVVHFNVTRSPSDDWVAQQLRDATPYGVGPRFLIRDRDDKYGPKFKAVAKGAGITILMTAVRAPLMNSICERFLGSVRRECLDHVLIFGEKHLWRVLADYVRYFVESRPHQGLGQLTPAQVENGQTLAEEVVGGVGKIECVPVLGGLHHEYRRAE